MAFTLSTRSLVLAALAVAALTASPANAVDFLTATDSTDGAAASGTVTTAPAATNAAETPAPTAADAADPAAASASADAATPAPAATEAESETADAATPAPAATEAESETADAATPSSTVKKTTTKTTTSSIKGWPGPIVVKGNKFFNADTGLEFRMKGMAYYPRPNAGELANVNNYDWTTDEHEAVWAPHIEVMKDLGVNTIRLYSVDPGQSHDKFMCACAEAGIYVLIGMAAPCKDCAILDEKPPKCYPDALFTRIQMVYNAFAVYDNTLGFSVGNENNLLRKYEAGGGQTMPCVKALLRDTRNYAATCAGFMRQVPIGLDLADILPREQWMQYFDCAADNNEYSRAEWIGFNPYVECDPTTNLEYSQSTGLQELMAAYEKVQYPRPLMFGEFGCNLGKNTIDGYENQRAFYDARWMNEEKDMTDQIVGGNVFEFVTEIPNTVAKALTKTADAGRYGIGYFDPLTCDHDTIPCEFVPYPEYENLKTAYTTTKESTLTLDSYKVVRETVLSCPANLTSDLQPMPTSEPVLACSSAQPVCGGVKSNNHPKSTSPAPALGSKADPSNTDDPVGGNSTTAAAVTAFVSAAATALSMVAAVALV